MQYYSSKYINDTESVILGIEKINLVYKASINEFKNGNKEECYGDWKIRNELSSAYNTGTQYNKDVQEMWREIMEKFYPNTSDVLLKNETATNNT